MTHDATVIQAMALARSALADELDRVRTAGGVPAERLVRAASALQRSILKAAGLSRSGLEFPGLRLIEHADSLLAHFETVLSYIDNPEECWIEKTTSILNYLNVECRHVVRQATGQ